MTKTIEVSDEMYDKLIELGNEMTTQDPRGTRMPHMFQIRDFKRAYDWELNGNTQIWVDRGAGIEIEDVDDLIGYLESSGHFDNCEDYEQQSQNAEIVRLWEEDEIGDFIEENCPDLEQCSYTMEPVYTNCFLTAKAAEEHLRLNHYHYHKDADVYLNHAWRNPEAELVSEFLCGLVGKKLHT